MRRTAILFLAGAALGSSTGCGACLRSAHELVYDEAATLSEGSAEGRDARDRSPLDPWDRSTGQIAASRCGHLGLLWLDAAPADDPGGWALRLRQTGVDGAVEELTLEDGRGEPPVHAWSFAFDTGCDPIVVVQTAAGWRLHRGDDGIFVAREVEVDWSAWFGVEPAEVQHWTLLQGIGEEVTLFARAWGPQGEPSLLAGTLGDGDALSWTAAPLEADWEPLSVAADPAGGLHLAFRQQEALRWGRWGGQAWQVETIEDAAGDRVPAWGGASLALNRTGQPHVASTSARLDESGAPLEAELRHHNRQGAEAWATCGIVASAGGFAGALGDCCSGADPALALDEEDRPHIVFNDVAVFEGPEGRDWTAGRLRYVFDNGRSWDDHVVIDQRAGGAELLDLRHPMVALGRDGVVHFAGAERSTAAASWSELDAPHTLRTLHVRATRVLLP